VEQWFQQQHFPVCVNSRMAETDQDDIDTLLSAAGTFVREQKALVSSVIGPHSAVFTSPQLMQGNVSIPSDIHESSANVTSDPPTLTSAINNVHRDAAVASESSSASISANGSVRRNKFLHHSAG